MNETDPPQRACAQPIGVKREHAVVLGGHEDDIVHALAWDREIGHVQGGGICDSVERVRE